MAELNSVNLSQTTNFRLFQTKRICGQQYWIWWKWQKVLQLSRKHLEKEKLLFKSNFSFSYSVFKRFVLQTRKNQGLLRKGFISALILQQMNCITSTGCCQAVLCHLSVQATKRLLCMVFNFISNSISVKSRWPVHLSMLSWSSFNQYSTQYYFQATGCFYT